MKLVGFLPITGSNTEGSQWALGMVAKSGNHFALVIGKV